MPYMSQITIIGHLGKDLEIASTPSNTEVNKFSVAVSTSLGNNRKTTDWFEVVKWGKLQDFIKEKLRAGGTVLLDRYVYSNIAYQCAKMPTDHGAEELREWILNTEFGQFDLPRPDLNIFLDVPIGFVKESLSRQRGGNDRGYLNGAQDIHEADIEFQKRVRAMYLRQAEVDKSLIVVDCADDKGLMLPPEAIFAKLKAVYEER